MLSLTKNGDYVTATPKERKTILYLHFLTRDYPDIEDIALDYGRATHEFWIDMMLEIVRNEDLSAVIRDIADRKYKFKKGPVIEPSYSRCVFCSKQVLTDMYQDHLTTNHADNIKAGMLNVTKPEVMGLKAVIAKYNMHKAAIENYEKQLSKIGKGWTPKKATLTLNLRTAIDKHKEQLKAIEADYPELVPNAV